MRRPIPRRADRLRDLRDDRPRPPRPAGAVVTPPVDYCVVPARQEGAALAALATYRHEIAAVADRAL